MIKHSVLLLALCTILTCSHTLPSIKQNGVIASPAEWSFFFTDKKIKLIHSIEASLPNNEQIKVIGISIISPFEKEIHSVVLTIEGIVLLEVIYKDNTVTTIRAVPPFDSEDNSVSLISDVALILLKPSVDTVTRFNISDKEILFRCITADTIIDIHKYLADYSVQMNHYTDKKLLKNTITYTNFNEDTIPQNITFINHGLFGYVLSLELMNYSFFEDNQK
ncbi:MAG: hypothetical protein PF637_03650 [Spirochaetes bacterium]|jgi:hypothetical protein|nr:hypothetical protein [Spirochaetota bacterium]